MARSPEKKIVSEDCARNESCFIAQEIAHLGPAGLGADRWRDVAVLCPRRNWLQQIHRELVLLGVPAQLHSGSETLARSTPRTWLTALVWIAAHPEDSFEIAGVLRDILGVSDHDMAVYTGGSGDLLRLDRFREREPGDGPIHAALAILHHARSAAENLPLHSAIRQVVEHIRLRERLVAIHDEHPALVDQELDETLAWVDQRAAEGATLGEVARELRDALNQASPIEEEVRDAVQLYTSHKAKGLEWQTVIMPFMFRAIDVKSHRYPRLVAGPTGEELYRDRAGFDAGAKEFVTRRERQQLQRLLYVTCTRPRHNLLFVDDETAFEGIARQGIGSFARLLGFDAGDHRDIWKALPEKLTPKPASGSAPSVAPDLIPPSPPLTAVDVRAAGKSADRFPRRVTPHALALHGPAESEPERRTGHEEDRPEGNNPGILYGTWWHDLMESIPWSQPQEAWQARFDSALEASPQPERSAREWELFRDSNLAGWLATPGLVIQKEFPFLLPESEELCLEGIMDLAIYAPHDQSWRVIDWKTNRPGPRGSAGVVEIYRPQIEAYTNALRTLLGTEVRGSLYLTASGEWIDL